MYHWDLPQTLQNEGGWANRKVIDWFSEYTKLCAIEFGPKVKHWMVFNEPAAFLGLGFLVGYHAPGKRNISAFLKASHHACLAMAESGRSVLIILKRISHFYEKLSAINYQAIRKNKNSTLIL